MRPVDRERVEATRRYLDGPDRQITVHEIAWLDELLGVAIDDAALVRLVLSRALARAAAP